MINYEENIGGQGARVHNLKNIDVTNTREKLGRYYRIVPEVANLPWLLIAIYAEGQTRYIETFFGICTPIF